MWNTWSDFDRTFWALDELRRRMNYVFGDLAGAGGWDAWNAPRPSAGAGQVWPRANLRDTGEELVLEALVPGVADEDLQMTATRDSVTLSGTRRVDVPEDYSVHRQERGSFQFSRSFTLPAKIDPEKVRADLTGGVLTVHLAKAAEAKPRQITVKASA